VAAQTKALNVKANYEQIEYYINSVQNLRKDMADLMSSAKDQKRQSDVFEMKLSEMTHEKQLLEAVNENLVKRVQALEYDNAKLQSKIEMLELHNKVVDDMKSEIANTPPFHDGSLPPGKDIIDSDIR
jgi:chromosome segregation ATPase